MAYGGLHWQPSEVMALPIPDFLFYVERLEKQKRREQAAIDKAARAAAR